MTIAAASFLAVPTNAAPSAAVASNARTGFAAEIGGALAAQPPIGTSAPPPIGTSAPSPIGASVAIASPRGVRSVPMIGSAAVPAPNPFAAPTDMAPLETASVGPVATTSAPAVGDIALAAPPAELHVGRSGSAPLPSDVAVAFPGQAVKPRPSASSEVKSASSEATGDVEDGRELSSGLDRAPPPAGLQSQLFVQVATIAAVPATPSCKLSPPAGDNVVDAEEPADVAAEPGSSATGGGMPALAPATVPTTLPATDAAPPPSEASRSPHVAVGSQPGTTLSGPEAGTPSQAPAPDTPAPDTSAAVTAFAERLTSSGEMRLAMPALGPEVGGPTALAVPLAPPPIRPVVANAAATPATPTPDQPRVEARPGRIGREMGVEIARRLSVGGDELTVRLNPIEMGRIEVRLSFDERGSLRVGMAAESAAALDMLRRDSAELGRALADAGVRADASGFRFDSRSGHSEGNQFWQRQSFGGGSGRGGAQPSTGHGAAEDGATEDLQYRPLRTRGRVNLMA